MNSTKKIPQATCNANLKGYHVCECYGHVQDLPDYRKLTVPRTLQGFYAKEGSGCPCIPNKQEKNMNTLYCSTNPSTCERLKPVETYRTNGPWKHKVYKADGIDKNSSAICESTSGTRLHFPNARNYGGTETQKGFPKIGGVRRKTQEEKRYERMHDRKEFLKAVLRDEMQNRADSEDQLQCLEHELGLLGSRHARMLDTMAGMNTQKDDEREKVVSKQYNDVMNELRYVLGQPVGSKLNIVHMHYLLKEQERLSYLREREKKLPLGLSTTGN